MYSPKYLAAVYSVLTSDDAPFYAADRGFSGGVVSAMSQAQLIKRTGRSKTVMVPIGDHLFKECKVSEWVRAPKTPDSLWALAFIETSLREFAEHLETISKLAGWLADNRPLQLFQESLAQDEG